MTDISEVYKPFFRRNFLTVADGSTPNLKYPTDIDTSHHMRIKAYEYNHPIIKTSKYIDSVTSNSARYKKVMDVGKEIVSKAADAIGTSILEDLKKMGRMNGTFFTFYTYVPGSLSTSITSSWDMFTTDLSRQKIMALKEASSLLNKSNILQFVTGGDAVGYGLYRGGKSMVPAETAIYKESTSSGISLIIRMAPKNSKESNIMLDVIKLFRHAARGTLGENSTFFDYPPLFDITICPKRSTEQVKKSAYQKFPPMYLSSMNVIYSDGSMLSNFFHDGVPTDATLNLSFTPVGVTFNGAPWEEGFRS